MPNHCANTMKITATTPESLELLAKLRHQLTLEDKRIFHTIHPCPDDLTNAIASFGVKDEHAENIEKYGYAHWYDFCVAEWGTKWDAYEVDILEDKDDTLTISFDTAWAPPTGVYATLLTKGFLVEATYCESGCDFIGYWKDGVEHTESLSEVAPTHEDNDDRYIEDCFDLDDYFYKHGITHSPAHFGG